MPPLRSADSPIRVDFVPGHVTGLRGRLGMTFAPGKKDARWNRSLDEDLKRLAEVYRARTLVTLLEPHERTRSGIAELVPRATAALGEVIELPIPDLSVPVSMPQAVATISAVLERAAAGNNVVVHCYGGRGRAGSFVAACLVARGLAPEAAIREVRRARAETVENPAQERFVHELLGLVPAVAKGTTSPPFSRVRGCLLGGALGDALGYPVEFIASASTIESRFGRTPPPDLFYASTRPAEISDDTQMTLFTAEGLIRARQGHDQDVVPAVQRALHRWFSTQEQADSAPASGWLVRVPELASRRAPGNTCLGSLRGQARDWHTPSIDTPTNDSKGCGAIMRAAPVGLIAPSRSWAFETARDTSVLTHGHPSGYLSAAYFASLVFDLARGVSLDAAMGAATELLCRERGHEETLAAVGAGSRATADAAALEALGGGWTGESALAIALAVARSSEASTPEGFAAALWRAAAHGGDSDSTGSIVGNLLGAQHGDAVLPPHWVDAVELRDVLERVASDLYDSGVLGSELDHESYPPG